MLKEKELLYESAGKVYNFNFLRAREALNNMEDWLVSEKTMKLPEHKVEIGLEKQGRELCRLLLQAYLEHRGTGRVGSAIEVRSQGGTRVQKETRVDSKVIITIFGEVKAGRTAYTSPGQKTIHPLDQDLEFTRKAFSYEIKRRVAEESVRGPFDEVVDSIDKNTGNKMSKRSTEQIAEEASRDFDAFYDRRKTVSTKGTGSLLIGAIDCKGVPLVKPVKAEDKVRRKKGEKPNKKKMATVAAVYTQKPRRRTPEEVVASLFKESTSEGKPKRQYIRPENKRVWASLEKSKEELISDVKKEMMARNSGGRKKTIALVTDGERGLQRLVREQFRGSLLILDLLHVLEYLWKAAHGLYEESSQEAVDWVKQHALMILRGEVSQVVKGMRQSVTKRKIKGAKKKAIMTAAAYFFRNRLHMCYHEYLEKGLPIASGAVEGACKNLVKDRMERSGMRWKIPGAEAVLKLRAIKLSGDWEEYWTFYIKQEQRRLYAGIKWKMAS